MRTQHLPDIIIGYGWVQVFSDFSDVSPMIALNASMSLIMIPEHIVISFKLVQLEYHYPEVITLALQWM